jgi:positive regulator of sigma E activity
MRVSRANVIRAVKMAFIIGPLLTLINQTWLVQRLVSGEAIPAVALYRVALTFAVPFAVSLYSSTMADRARSRAE